MPETITLVLNANSNLKHEHGIDTFVIHMTPELAAHLLALSKVVRDLAGQPNVSDHLSGRQVAAIALSEPGDAPGLFTPPNFNTRSVRRAKARYAGVWLSPHNPAIARPAGVTERHVFITPDLVWWSARASIKRDEVTSATLRVETLAEIVAGTLRP